MQPHPGPTGDDAVEAPATVSQPSAEDGIDPSLLARADQLLQVPLVDRADAFDELNDDVVAALRAIEDQ